MIAEYKAPDTYRQADRARPAQRGARASRSNHSATASSGTFDLAGGMPRWTVAIIECTKKRERKPHLDRPILTLPAASRADAVERYAEVCGDVRITESDKRIMVGPVDKAPSLTPRSQKGRRDDLPQPGEVLDYF
jgi:hypothetical protein